MATFGRNLARARKDAGLTQEALAERSGVRQGAISEWEKGKSTPNAKNLLRLAVGLNSSVEYLLAEVDIDYDSQRARAHTSLQEREIGVVPNRHSEVERDLIRQTNPDGQGEGGIHGSPTSGDRLAEIRSQVSAACAVLLGTVTRIFETTGEPARPSDRRAVGASSPRGSDDLRDRRNAARRHRTHSRPLKSPKKRKLA